MIENKKLESYTETYTPLAQFKTFSGFSEFMDEHLAIYEDDGFYVTTSEIDKIELSSFQIAHNAIRVMINKD